MSNIIPFDFDGNEIRAVYVDDEPYFVARDVAIFLEYAKPRNAVAAHCKGALKRSLPTNGGIQELTLIPERDVYRLVMRSRLPKAEAFEEWVVGEVLPSIRKTGSYGQDIVAALSDPEVLRQTLLNYTEKVVELEHKVKEDAPKVEFHDQVAISQDAILVQEAAKVIGTGRNRLMSYLRQIGWITRRNEPYQDKITTGYMDVKVRKFEHPEQGLQSSITPLITGKGLTKLQKLWRQSQLH